MTILQKKTVKILSIITLTIDKLTLVMLSAIVLAIGMLIYNPIQQQILLNQVKQVVLDNQELLLSQSREMANSSHSDQLQRQLEHNTILNRLANLLEQNTNETTSLLNNITKGASKQNLNLTIINNKILEDTNKIIHRQLIPMLANLSRGR